MRDGAAKGKIERFFRTVRDEFLTRDLSRLHTLRDLNAAFIEWLELTYSAKLDALAPDTLETYLNTQLDLAGLPHHTFTDEALHLVLRVSQGVLRAVRNLCVGALIEAVRDRTKTVDLQQVNAVLMQPHWRHDTRDETRQPLVFTNRKPKN